MSSGNVFKCFEYAMAGLQMLTKHKVFSLKPVPMEKYIIHLKSFSFVIFVLVFFKSISGRQVFTS